MLKGGTRAEPRLKSLCPVRKEQPSQYMHKVYLFLYAVTCFEQPCSSHYYANPTQSAPVRCNARKPDKRLRTFPKAHFQGKTTPFYSTHLAVLHTGPHVLRTVGPSVISATSPVARRSSLFVFERMNRSIEKLEFIFCAK